MTGYTDDIAAIMARRHDNGADHWARIDGRISKGSPFTTLDCALMLSDLGVPASDPVLSGAVDLIFAAQQDDGRFRVAPGGAIYPCHTISSTQFTAPEGGGAASSVTDEVQRPSSRIRARRSPHSTCSGSPGSTATTHLTTTPSICSSATGRRGHRSDPAASASAPSFSRCRTRSPATTCSSTSTCSRSTPGRAQ